MLGHAHPAITNAVRRQATRGANFAYVSRKVLQLGEEMVRAIPCAERVRFCASGTEAMMYSVRLARAFRRRHKVLKFEGAYHGANQVGVMSLFPRLRQDYPHAEPTSAGLLPGEAEAVLVAPYNDLAVTEQIVRDHADELAAIVVEPLHRCTTPQPFFLDGLRKVADQHGLLLIFDETVTGFRLAYGGAQEYYGVVPDLAAYGKGLGGGYPIGAVAGRADILNLCAESRLGECDYVWFASSTGGNPISASAALATLAEMREPGTYDRFFAIGSGLRKGLRDLLDELAIEAQVLGDGPLCAVSFTAHPVFDYRSAARADSARARAFLLGLFEAGVFLNPMSTKFYLSLAHDQNDISHILAMARSVLEGLKESRE
jgi:glutamate-1-semialdehyde 2,1-aminomutase